MEHRSEHPVNWLVIRRLVLFNGIAAFLVVFGVIVYQSLLLSLSLSLFLTYLLAPVVDWMTHRQPQKRPYVCLLLIITLLSLVGVLIASLLPEISRQLMEIIKIMPRSIEFLISKIDPVKSLVASTGFIAIEDLNEAVARFDLVGNIGTYSQKMVEKLWSSTPSVVSRVLNFALVPILLFFLLNDLPRLKSAVSLITPPDLRDSMIQFRDKIDLTLKSVIKGQFMVAMTLAVLYMVGLSVVGLQAGLAIGAIAGICRIVPYLDVIVGISLSLLVVITDNLGFGMFAGVCVVFLIVQVLDGMFITPRIIGERAGLHPGVVIASVIAFGDWFGFVGILIAVPVVAIIKVLVQASFPYYQLSPFYWGSRRDSSQS